MAHHHSYLAVGCADVVYLRASPCYPLPAMILESEEVALC